MADLASAAIGRTCEIVPLGVDHEVFHPADERGDELLYVADFYGHKRHDLVLDAWLLLPAPRPILHLVGDPAVDRASFTRLMRRIGEISDPETVVVEHSISVDRLVAAYHRARVFVMASEHESFCMPLVESMACGVPPVARNLASLRESGRDGATYVEGDDPAEWAAAIGDLLDSDEHHRRARERAVSVAASYSWGSLADAVLRAGSDGSV
jgi:glycosyltransferase involved in cell wall biosynthesis